MKTRTSIDMTHGPLLGKILLFSLPLMASNILQMLFNAADVVVVGRFAGYACLAAVGGTVSIIALFVNLLVGISVGVNVVIARYLGLTGHEREISRALHTSLVMALLGGLVLGVLGILSSGWMMNFLSMPADVRPLALIYVRIYFVGTPFTMLYNYGAAALRAKGNTRQPLWFLLVSGVLNLLLNLFFVIVLRMHVMGVALATVLSQCLSAVLILNCLAKAQDELHFSWRTLCIDPVCLREMARIGVPAGVQACLFSVANLVIQGAINSYGSVVMAGCSAAMNIENFLYLSMNAFQQSCQTFTSQNLGAGQNDRVGRVMRTCLLCTVVLGVVQSAATLVFSNQLIGIYNSDPEVIRVGAERLWIVASTYTIWGISDVLMGGFRGYGIAIAPMLINLVGTCGLRLCWIAGLDTSRVGVAWVHIAYPVSWICILVVLSLFWVHLRKKEAENQPQRIGGGE